MDPHLPREVTTLEFCTRCGHSVSPHVPGNVGRAESDFGAIPTGLDTQSHYWCSSCREHWLAVNLWETGTICKSCKAILPLTARYCGACGSKARDEAMTTSLVVRLVLVEKDDGAPTDMALGDSIEISLPDQSERLVLGKAPSNDIVVSAPSVGRQVVELSCIPEGLRVDDLGSGGGSALETDGVRTDRPHGRCPDQSVLWIGRVGFRVEFPCDDVFELVLHGQDNRLREALARGVTPMLQRDSLTPLHLAAACDRVEAASILFEAGAVIDVEAWPESSKLAAMRRSFRGSGQQSPAAQESALPEGGLWGEVERRTRRSFRGEYCLGALGCTPLHIASDRGCAPMVRWLLDHGADAHLPVYLDGGPEGFWEWSPLDLAVRGPEPPNPDVVSMLEEWARHHPKTDADAAVLAFRRKRVPD
jgi:hypothetical protein